ncbi:hypothetical protein BT96DRAFT_698741 [Gymnopus androsaceus JB14]|uniref:F-box domain-containing protein n=1 Tax=Gymnopus androsaceus JB14 TaxID=1447944 RepID=A0A6A4I8P3_9AGAR|nr:hypothetical protein BT96DRAFT_698741 [Gymnopus androsaceus JB14]
MNFRDLYAKLPFKIWLRHSETEILLSCDRDLEDAENEVMRLQSEIIYIQEQQKRLRDYRMKVHSLSSPTREIPNEVLASIFDYACEQNLLQEFPWSVEVEDDDDEELFHAEDYPLPTNLTSPIISYLPALSISATCFRWRSVSLSYPGLWSKLKLEVTTSKYSAPGPFITPLKLFLSRSGQKPLDIELNVHGPYRTDSSLSGHVTNLLAEHSKRWKAFKLMCTYLELPETTKIDFSMLESLDLREFKPYRLTFA